MPKKIYLDINEIIKSHKSGVSIVDISKSNNVSISPIRKILKDNSINTRRDTKYYSKQNQKYSINENYFSNINTQEKAYILGMLFADGNMHKIKKLISLELHSKDINILEKINIELNSNKPLFEHVFLYQHKNVKIIKKNFRLDITNYKIYNDLLLIGLTPKKSLTISYPKINENLHCHFIRGYFDGDGCITFKQKASKKTGIEFSLLGTLNFLTTIQNIFKDKLNINIPISIVGNIYRLRIGNRDSINKLYNFMYNGASLYLDRKFEKFNLITNG